MYAERERPLSAVLQDIVGNVQHIARAEMRLAKTEVTEEVSQVSAASVLVALGLVMVAFAALFGLLGLVYALSLVMPAWAAALVVAGGEAVMATIFLVIGIRKFKATRAAPRTRATVKENVEWAKEQMR
jgi:uncharacterized membrane protein YqjE